MNLRFVVILSFFTMALAPIFHSADAQELRTGLIEIEYGDSKIEGLRPIRDRIVAARGLETIQTLLQPFKLPRKLIVSTAYCDGEPNAWYESDRITVCYEYLNDILKTAARVKSVTPRDVILGAVLDVFLHEAGHALFDYWSTPIFGREEDAADQFSAFIMLQMPRDDAVRLISGAAAQYRSEMRRWISIQPVRSFSDVHGTPAQRFYNVLCIAYGADPVAFEGLLKRRYLPKNRAEDCEFEYRQVAHAFDRLVKPFIDEDLAASNWKKWIEPRQPQSPSGTDKNRLRGAKFR